MRRRIGAAFKLDESLVLRGTVSGGPGEGGRGQRAAAMGHPQRDELLWGTPHRPTPTEVHCKGRRRMQQCEVPCGAQCPLGGGGGLEGAKCPLPHPQDPLGALERDLALQMQIARAAHRLCREENISKQLRRRRKTAALKEEQKLKALEDTLLAERRAMSAGGAGGAQGENGGLPSGGEGMCVAMGPRCTCTAVPRVVRAPQNAPLHGCTPISHPQGVHPDTPPAMGESAPNLHPCE